MNTYSQEDGASGDAPTSEEWGQFADDLDTIGDGISGGDDDKYDEFNRQFPNPDLCDRTYRNWLAVNDADKLKRSGDVWSEPNSIKTWRARWRDAQLAVRAMAPGLTGPQEWAIISAGSWDASMNWTPPPAMLPGGAGPSAVPGVNAAGGGFVMSWPWQANAVKTASPMQWIVWAGLVYVGYRMVKMLMGQGKRYRKTRRTL